MIGRYGGYFEEDIRRFMCDRAYHNNGTVESCMAIYLGMAMEMP